MLDLKRLHVESGKSLRGFDDGVPLRVAARPETSGTARVATIRHTAGMEPAGNDRLRVIATTLDFEKGEACVVRSDMQELRTELDISQFPAGDRIARVTYSPDLNGLHCATTLGDEILAELPSLTSSSSRSARTVVYLDQKDWRTLRDVRYEPDLIRSPKEREAAAALIQLVEERKVILPFSSGHLVETTKWPDKDRRYELGLTILQLSRGWQMTDPLSIREGEVRAALTHRGQVSDLRVPNVITLAPNAALSGRSEPYRPSIQMPPRDALATRALASLQSYFSVMLDEDRIEVVDVPGWTARQQEMSDWIAEVRPSRQVADERLDRFFIEDTSYEISRAARAVGLGQSQLLAWVEHGAARDVPLMPSLGLFREVLRERHLNGRNVWKQSDLTDMAYLSCAAGYADHVVGEKHFSNHVANAASRLGRKTSVHRNLRDLLPHLG